MAAQMSKLYTVSLEFFGGTYMHQCTAPTPQIALENWLVDLDRSLVEGMNDGAFAQLGDIVHGEAPTLVDGLDSVWCVSGLLDDELFIVHLVETAM